VFSTLSPQSAQSAFKPHADDSSVQPGP